MSEELVNQLTLNFLISKNQLQKLNKKLKENTEIKRRSDKEIYCERIQELFSNLLVNQPPEDLLQDVKTGFDFFIDKSIYYFKAKDNNELLEKERTEQDIIIQDDIDFEKEEQDIANGNYKEKDADTEEEEEEEEEDADTEEDEEEDAEEDADTEEDEDREEEKIIKKSTYQDIKLNKQPNKIENNQSINVKQKHTKLNNSVGVDNIQKLPLDWFQNVRQNYKKNNIIHRKKDD
jgi:hypothetical protein